MLYTRKGDDGTTQTFNCDQRMTKNSTLAEALGTVDEVNALLGVVKMKGGATPAIDGKSYEAVLGQIQQDLFVVQAELAGAERHMDESRVARLEAWTDAIERELPPITSFSVSGGTELSALCDLARTVARRAERRVVAAFEDLPPPPDKGEGGGTVSKPPLFKYMNRLSSVLYALARLANHRAGIIEEKPRY